MTAVRFGIRATGFLAVLLLGLVLFLLGRPFGQGGGRLGKLVWFRGCLLLLNIRVERHGKPFTACPTLFVANHVSWLDIPVLGEAVDGTFVAKSEVASWPVFGWLARLVGTMFVRRHWRMALIQRNELAARLRSGTDIVLFPEGTSTPGQTVGRFKSSLFGAAEPQILDRPVAVQPVTLAYVTLADGTPIGPGNADRYAWYGDAVFAPHLFSVLCDQGCRIQLVFHEPVLSWEVQSRKALARQAEAAIALDLQARRRQAALVHQPQLEDLPDLAEEPAEGRA